MDIREFNKPVTEGTANTQVQTPKQANVATELIAPVDEMLEYLKENNLSENDIFTILDTLLTSGNVTWSFKIFNKIPVTFKSRPMWVNELLVKTLEDEAPKTVALFSEIVGKYNMSGSLVGYNDEKYDVSTREGYDENMERISNMTHTIYAVLVKQLAIFDKLVAVATSDWAIENFMKPPLEESVQKL